MKVLVFGDSITQGFYDTQGGWVQRLAAHYHQMTLKNMHQGNNSWVEVFNLGISGDTVAGVAARIETETKARRLYDSEETILIAAGLNDAILRDNVAQVDVYDFQVTLEKLIKKAKRLTKNVVIIGLTPVDETLSDPWKWSSSGKQWKNNRIDLFEDTLKQAAMKEGVPFVPVYDPMTAKLQAGHSLHADGLHPNDDGHELIYEIIKPQLKELIG